MLFDPDVRAMIRLLGDLSGDEENLAAKRPVLLGQLCELVEGDRWSWVLERVGTAKRAGVILEELGGGRDAAARDLSLSAVRSRGGAPSPGARRPASDRGLTLTIREISGNVVSTIRLAREAGRAPFDARESKIAQIILSEIPWLHEQRPDARGTAPIGQGLAPRQRAVLMHWVDGLSSREIAARLRLSPWTVQDYIKEIYKQYRVNCRAELLRRMTLGWEQSIR